MEQSIDIDTFMLSAWLKECLGREVESMKVSTAYLFTAANRARLHKLHAYQVYCGQVKNFSLLVPSLNEWQEDFDETLTLLLGGHYKACMLMLRSHFELASALINAITSNQPRINFLAKRAQADRHFQPGTLRDKVGNDWCDAIIALYSELSRFSHASGEGLGHVNLSPQLPPPAFDEFSFDYCLMKINEVITITQV